MNYVALLLESGGIYGVAACETEADNTEVVEWARRNNVSFTTGELYTPDNLLDHAAMHFRTTPKQSQ